MPYTATITNDTRIARRVAPGFGFIFGSVDITEYHQTKAEITAITNYFKKDPVVVVNGISDNGYLVAWNASDKAFEARYPHGGQVSDGVPGLVIEEVVTVTSHAGTLAHLPAYIVACVSTAGGTSGPSNIAPVGVAPLTLECAVNFATGGLIFNTSDAVTAALVTYFPQRYGTVFAPENMVIDEEIVASATPVALEFPACAVQYVWDDTDGTRLAMEPVGEQPTASGNAVVDIDDSGDTKIDAHGDDATNTFKVTYLKLAGLGNVANALGDANVTLSGSDPEQYDFNNEGFIQGLVVPGMGVNLVGEQTATNVEYILSGPSGTTGAGVPTWHPTLNTIRTQEATAVDTLSIPWFIFDPVVGHSGYDAGATNAEVINGVDVGAASFIAFGVIN